VATVSINFNGSDTALPSLQCGAVRGWNLNRGNDLQKTAPPHAWRRNQDGYQTNPFSRGKDVERRVSSEVQVGLNVVRIKNTCCAARFSVLYG
jgi:hypothetical protein